MQGRTRLFYLKQLPGAVEVDPALAATQMKALDHTRLFLLCC